MDNSGPMDIDPIDDGPREATRGIVPMTGSTGSTALTPVGGPAHEISKEEEARQAIEMLRGEDVSNRVAAASRLESVALVLGEERTRNVRLFFVEVRRWQTLSKSTLIFVLLLLFTLNSTGITAIFN